MGARLTVRKHKQSRKIMSTKQTLQKQTQQDWANREYIEVITSSIKKITDFLNSFGIPFLLCLCLESLRSVCSYSHLDMSCRGRLAVLNEKLTRLERKIEYLEARVSLF